MKVFDIACLSSRNTLQQNIECLFYPNSSGNGGVLWGVLRYVGYVLVFIYIVMAASKLIF